MPRLVRGYHVMVLAGLLHTLNPLVLLFYSIFLVFGLRTSYPGQRYMEVNAFEISQLNSI